MMLTTRARSVAAFLVVLCVLAAPMTALARRGERQFRRGLQHEAAQQWERAAQEFALAVAANPADAEYQLHYRRAMFNASQMFMQQGRALAERSDFVGAYNAFRQAYGYDPVNELARSEMARMLRLQQERTGGNGNGTPGGGSAPAATTVGQQAGTPPATAAATARPAQDALAAPRAEQLTNIRYSGGVDGIIRTLAERLNINVMFDQSFPRRDITLDLRSVTTAQALDYILISQGLFFQRLGRRTILIADQSRRPIYQQLAVRTYYLQHIAPDKAVAMIRVILPAQAGRMTLLHPNVETNSITVRDTVENVRLIGELIQSIDKDRAEVVMDVNIYEISRTDLLQIGNQFGTQSALENLGGLFPFSVLGGAARQVVVGTGAAAAPVPTALGAALVLPASALALLQRTDRSRLLASTQVHAFDREQSVARIGQRVPVQTATTFPFSTVGQQTPQQGGTTGVFGSGFPVINFEPTGLTLKFTPEVFPNLDVQVKMEIESKDVLNPGSLTPTFTERTINGTARIQNNRTMMLASVAQDRQSQGRTGLPLLGLIPILGRLFTAPRRDNSQVDIVIAVTPRVLRAPAITPSDEQMRPSGTIQTPTAGTLAMMVEEEEAEDQRLAALRAQRQTAAATVASPAPVTNSTNSTSAPAAATYQATSTVSQAAQTAAQPAAPASNASVVTNAANPSANDAGAVTQNSSSTAPVNFIPAPRALLDTPLVAASNAPGGNQTAVVAPPPRMIETAASSPAAANPAAAHTPGSSTAVSGAHASTPAISANAGAQSNGQNAALAAANERAPGVADLRLVAEQQELRVGERRRLMLVLTSDMSFMLGVLTFRFDPRLLAVRSVTRGNIAMSAQDEGPPLTQSVDPRGLLMVTVTPPPGVSALPGRGVLLFIEVEGLAAGEGDMALEESNLHLIAADGRNAPTRLASPVRLTVRQ